MTEPIDLVVTYVDGNEPVWRSTLNGFNASQSPVRFRDWKLMRYWFRCVERNMPFIRKIHLVVSNSEQVPKWVDVENVHVVLHRDMIPEELLPTFNSTTIEMFLHRIPGLSEKFIYSNDDMFANNPISSDFFFTDDGLPIYSLKHRDSAREKVFWKQCKNSWMLAKELTGKMDGQRKTYYFIEHSMTPMVKSIAEEVHFKAGDKIREKCTKFREPWNFTQYLFPDYAILTENSKLVDSLSFRYVLTSDKINKISNVILSDEFKIVCLNDSMENMNFESKSRKIRSIFQKRYEWKSKYELDG